MTRFAASDGSQQMEFEIDFSLPARRDLKNLEKSYPLVRKWLIDAIKEMQSKGTQLPRREEFIVENELSFLVYTQGNRIIVLHVMPGTTTTTFDDNTPTKE